MYIRLKLYSFLKLRTPVKHGYPAFLSFQNGIDVWLLTPFTSIWLKSNLHHLLPIFFFCISCLGRWHYLPLSHSDLKIWSHFSEAYFFLVSSESKLFKPCTVFPGPLFSLSPLMPSLPKFSLTIQLLSRLLPATSPNHLHGAVRLIPLYFQTSSGMLLLKL